MKIILYIICFFKDHPWQYNRTQKQRKCERCETVEVKNYYGKWVKADPRVKHIYPVQNDRIVKPFNPCD